MDYAVLILFLAIPVAITLIICHYRKQELEMKTRVAMECLKRGIDPDGIVHSLHSCNKSGKNVRTYRTGFVLTGLGITFLVLTILSECGFLHYGNNTGNYFRFVVSALLIVLGLSGIAAYRQANRHSADR